MAERQQVVDEAVEHESGYQCPCVERGPAEKDEARLEDTEAARDVADESNELGRHEGSEEGPESDSPSWQKGVENANGEGPVQCRQTKLQSGVECTDGAELQLEDPCAAACDSEDQVRKR